MSGIGKKIDHDSRRERKYKDKYQKPKKNKAYVAESTWSDSSSMSDSKSESEDEVYATMCLMEWDEDKVHDYTSTVEEVIDKYDELAALHVDIGKILKNF